MISAETSILIKECNIFSHSCIDKHIIFSFFADYSTCTTINLQLSRKTFFRGNKEKQSVQGFRVTVYSFKGRGYGVWGVREERVLDEEPLVPAQPGHQFLTVWWWRWRWWWWQRPRPLLLLIMVSRFFFFFIFFEFQQRPHWKIHTHSLSLSLSRAWRVKTLIFSLRRGV